MAARGPRLAPAFFATAVLAQAVGAADARATQLAAELQDKYARIKDFSADFVHTYAGGVLKKQITESGRVLIKKPGKMRWQYTKAEQKLFVSGGVKMYAYLPQDKQVLVTSVRQAY